LKGAAAHPRQRELNALAAGTHSFPFELLGPQREAGRRIVRTLQPDADKVSLLDRQGQVVKKLRRVHDAGIFEAGLPPRLRSYRLRLHARGGVAQDQSASAQSVESEILCTVRTGQLFLERGRDCCDFRGRLRFLSSSFRVSGVNGFICGSKVGILLFGP